jgi:hypothetical protein
MVGNDHDVHFLCRMRVEVRGAGQSLDLLGKLLLYKFQNLFEPAALLHPVNMLGHQVDNLQHMPLQAERFSGRMRVSGPAA